MKYVAHRGANMRAKENTIKAFKLAGDSSCDMMECDVRTTKDCEFVICHDDSYLRVYGVDKKVADFSFDEIVSDCKVVNKDVDEDESRPPLLSEYLDVCMEYKKGAVIELKEIENLDLLFEFKELIDNYPEVEILIISFNCNYLKFLSAIGETRLQLLTGEINNEIIYEAKANGFGLAPWDGALDKNTLKKLKRLGFKIYVWTVNDPKRHKELAKFSVGYVAADTF